MTKDNNIPNLIGIELGPTYLESIVNKISPEKGDENIEWRARLNDKCKQIKFYGQIKYYEHRRNSLIISTDFSAQIVIAVTVNGKEILLFDGCKHGYDAIMLNYGYTDEEINNRIPDQILFTKDNYEFEIILSAFYTQDYDDWITTGLYKLTEQGMINLEEASLMDFNEFKRNAFNCFEVLISDSSGKIYPILQKETS